MTDCHMVSYNTDLPTLITKSRIQSVRLTIFILTCIIIAGNGMIGNAQGECCEVENCKSKATEYATLIKGDMSFLPDLGSANDFEYRRILDEAIKYQTAEFNRMFSSYNKILKWNDKEGDKFKYSCVLNQLNDPKALKYLDILRKVYPKKSSELSPEFGKAWHLQSELGTGGINFGHDSERFVLSLKSLVSYTFTKKDEDTGGRIRLLAGPVVQYSGSNIKIGPLIRSEFRLFDLKASYFSLGNIKLFMEGQYLANDFEVGGGLAIELYKFGYWIGSAINTDNGSVSAQTGFMFRFELFNK